MIIHIPDLHPVVQVTVGDNSTRNYRLFEAVLKAVWFFELNRGFVCGRITKMH